ncbi:MAG: hypothetical protein IVW51_05555 [Thermaceae bacterium]|nr:hypothetical protein [Thermaceae bacterium]
MRATWKAGGLLILLSLSSVLAQNAGGLRFQRWSDPREGAFTLEVPVGWKISGGTVRHYAGAGGVSEVVMTSPDGQVMVRLGDVNLPTTFLVPNQTMSSLGCNEGCRPSSSAVVLRYLSGQNFAAYYVGQTMSQYCSSLGWTRKGNYPEYVRRQAQIMAQYGMPPFDGHTAGDVNYICKANGGTWVGYLFAETYAVNYQGTGTAWAVARLQGYTATPERAALADAVLVRALATMHTNPQWFKGEQDQAQRTVQMQLKYNAYTVDLMQQMHEFRLKAMDKWACIRGRLLQGQDPNFGQNNNGSFQYDPQCKTNP